MEKSLFSKKKKISGGFLKFMAAWIILQTCHMPDGAEMEETPLSRQRKKLNCLLLFGALLFAVHGVLHPLFHADAHFNEKASGQESVYQNDSSGYCDGLLSLHCPVCSGIFQAAELPELLLLPEVSRSVLQYPEYPGLPGSRRSAGFRARAPPCFA